jgi:hypothetical protein
MAGRGREVVGHFWHSRIQADHSKLYLDVVAADVPIGA